MAKTKKKKSASSWPVRVHRFTHQMFPVFPGQVAVAGGFLVSYLVLARILMPREFPAWEPLVGALSTLLLVYLLRVFDEIKDYPTDKVNFPDRPLVKGVVSRRDINILVAVLIGVIFLLQIPFLGRPVIPAFLIVFAFCLLMFKWFFAEKAIRRSLPLALITHNPVVYLLQLYTLSFFASFSSAPPAAIAYLVGEGLTGTAWEISRKIRGTSQEDTYTTYSKLWGPVVPVVLVAVLLLASWGLTFRYVALVHESPWAPWTWALPGAALIAWVVNAARYVSKPRVAPPFRSIVEGFRIALTVSLLICVFLATREAPV